MKPNEEMMKEQTQQFVAAYIGATGGNDEQLVEWLDNTLSDVKTAKNEGGQKRSVKNATLLVRFAKHVGIEHSLISAVYNPDPKKTTGVSMPNDMTSLTEISHSLITHFTNNGTLDMESTIQAMATQLTNWVNSFTKTQPAPVAEETNTAPAINFGGASDDLPSLDELADSEEDEQPTTTATERTFVLESWDKDTMAMIRSVSEADIEQARNVLLATAKDGEGYEQDKNKGTVRVSQALLDKRAGWGDEGLMMPVMADILEVRPKARVNRVNHDYKNRTWFPELVSTGNRNKDSIVKRICVKVVAYVINASGRNYYNMRFAWFVSDDFRENFKNWISFNTELADSPVIGGQAKSWNWELNHNSWSPEGNQKISTEVIDAMSDDDLWNL
tara:strand:+ start:103 stop:1266 length:1164 start_codon:yes stop_codon:yes gene_type:complete